MKLLMFHSGTQLIKMPQWKEGKNLTRNGSMNAFESDDQPCGSTQTKDTAKIDLKNSKIGINKNKLSFNVQVWDAMVMPLNIFQVRKMFRSSETKSKSKWLMIKPYKMGKSTANQIIWDTVTESNIGIKDTIKNQIPLLNGLKNGTLSNPQSKCTPSGVSTIKIPCLTKKELW